MQLEYVIIMAKNTMLLVFYLSMPVIIVTTAVGLLIALIQTLIQLQEQTLPFAVKLASMIVVFSFTGSWMANQVILFLKQVLAMIIEI